MGGRGREERWEGGREERYKLVCKNSVLAAEECLSCEEQKCVS